MPETIGTIVFFCQSVNGIHKYTKGGAMSNRIKVNGLSVAKAMYDFVELQALPGSGVNSDVFWGGFATLIADMTPINLELLKRRDELQGAISDWHIRNPYNLLDYKAFLKEIGYIVPEAKDFAIATTNVDPEIAKIPGPQLVVPILNARFALNAANARWGSLYDSLYGTDALGSLPQPGPFSPERGKLVVEWAKGFLDDVVPLHRISHKNVTGYAVVGGRLKADGCGLVTPSDLVGYTGCPESPTSVLLRNNGLHIEIIIDSANQIGQNDPASVADVRLESAMSAIMDMEDSVASVDAEDKVLGYSNWLGLMKGSLSVTLSKGGVKTVRRLNSELNFVAPNGQPLALKSTALMLVRNVGHLMTNPSILDAKGSEVFEGVMDAMITVLCSLHDLKKTTSSKNSNNGSIYVVKPKMHGPQEVAFTNEIFTRVEQILGLPKYTVKLGIMDEERRTTVNLKECIRAARHRVAFINTGFLDRTGDEFHTSMNAGPMVRKSHVKYTDWISAYEKNNVDVGIACGLRGKAQIGKGMWAKPDRMAEMLRQKIWHPKSGANCAWVPSPTGATLHVTHYHKVNVLDIQSKMKNVGKVSYLDEILTIPLAKETNWNATEIQDELDNNAQGILGYVVRWIDQGIGCSKVPDINNVGLMEDRATCRISSQHMTNWLHHHIVTKDQVVAAFKRMAVVVDGQNAGDTTYRSMAPNFDGIAFQTCVDLVLKGVDQPSGYTEPLLHAARLKFKAAR